MRHKMQRRFVLFTILVIIAIPLLMGQQGCEDITIPTLKDIFETEEIIEVRGTEIKFLYEDEEILREIIITHFHQGVRGWGKVYLTNDKGEVLRVLYQNLFYDLLNKFPNRTFIKKGSAKKGDLVGIEIKFKCFNPFGGCLVSKDFLGTYVLGGGQGKVKEK